MNDGHGASFAGVHLCNLRPVPPILTISWGEVPVRVAPAPAQHGHGASFEEQWTKYSLPLTLTTHQR